MSALRRYRTTDADVHLDLEPLTPRSEDVIDGVSVEKTISFSSDLRERIEDSARGYLQGRSAPLHGSMLRRIEGEEWTSPWGRQQNKKLVIRFSNGQIVSCEKNEKHEAGEGNDQIQVKTHPKVQANRTKKARRAMVRAQKESLELESISKQSNAKDQKEVKIVTTPSARSKGHDSLDTNSLMTPSDSGTEAIKDLFDQGINSNSESSLVLPNLTEDGSQRAAIARDLAEIGTSTDITGKNNNDTIDLTEHLSDKTVKNDDASSVVVSKETKGPKPITRSHLSRQTLPETVKAVSKLTGGSNSGSSSCRFRVPDWASINMRPTRKSSEQEVEGKLRDRLRSSQHTLGSACRWDSHRDMMRRVFPKSLEELEVELRLHTNGYRLGGLPSSAIQKWSSNGIDDLQSSNISAKKPQITLSPRGDGRALRSKSRDPDSQSNRLSFMATSTDCPGEKHCKKVNAKRFDKRPSKRVRYALTPTSRPSSSRSSSRGSIDSDRLINDAVKGATEYLKDWRL